MANENQAKWYIIHTFSGYESLVKKSLEQKIEINHLQDRFFAIKIPTELCVEERNGKRKVVERNVTPCYVYVKLIYSNEMWYLITNTRGVTGFVGPNGKALEMKDEEVRRMRLEEFKVDFDMQIGDNVTVVSGPFEGLVGTIQTIDEARQKVNVSLNMFGRTTPVDMDFDQIEKLTTGQQSAD